MFGVIDRIWQFGKFLLCFTKIIVRSNYSSKNGENKYSYFDSRWDNGLGRCHWVIFDPKSTSPNDQLKFLFSYCGWQAYNRYQELLQANLDLKSQNAERDSKQDEIDKLLKANADLQAQTAEKDRRQAETEKLLAEKVDQDKINASNGPKVIR